MESAILEIEPVAPKAKTRVDLSPADIPVVTMQVLDVMCSLPDFTELHDAVLDNRETIQARLAMELKHGLSESYSLGLAKALMDRYIHG